jgi:polyhydroxybutyrate depolymerase
MKRMTARAAAPVLASILAVVAAGKALASTVDEATLERPERARHYLVQRPGGAGPGRRPLVILLHGHGASAAQVMGRADFGGYRSDAWVRLAQREKIVLMAPQGLVASDGKAAWNDCKADSTTNPASDDTAFIAALIDTAIARYDADPERIYIYGASNGGTMAYRLGIELGPRLAAIAAQSALMAASSHCRPPGHPLPVFISHGTADRIAPYAGGKLGSWMLKGRGTGLGAEQSVTIWRRLAGLSDTPEVYRFPHVQPGDSTSATRYTWGPDPSRVQVVFIKVEGGGHLHASKTESLPWLLGKLVGDMNHDFDTEEEVWAFFKDKRAAMR